MINSHSIKDKALEVARKRFAYFGYFKTTMREIAKDLNLSPSHLRYYFTDKAVIYQQVLKTGIADFFLQCSKEQNEEVGIAGKINLFLEKRSQFFQDNLTLLGLPESLKSLEIQNLLAQEIQNFNSMEKEFYSSIIRSSKVRSDDLENKINEILIPCTEALDFKAVINMYLRSGDFINSFKINMENSLKIQKELAKQLIRD